MTTVIVRKGNKVLKVDEQAVEQYLKDGFDEVDEQGKVIKSSPNRNYSASEVEKLREADKARIAELEKQLEKLRKKSTE